MTENLASPNSADWSRSSAPCNFNTEPKNAHLQKERSLPNPIDTSWKLTLFTHNCKVCESSESATERLLLVLGWGAQKSQPSLARWEWFLHSLARLSLHSHHWSSRWIKNSRSTGYRFSLIWQSRIPWFLFDCSKPGSICGVCVQGACLRHVFCQGAP